MSLLGDIVGIGGTAYNINERLNAADALTSDIKQQVTSIGDKATQDMVFKPFTVASGTGSSQFDPNTGLSFTPDQKFNQYLQNTLNVANQATGAAGQQDPRLASMLQTLQGAEGQYAGRLGDDPRLGSMLGQLQGLEGQFAGGVGGDPRFNTAANTMLMKGAGEFDRGTPGFLGDLQNRFAQGAMAQDPSQAMQQALGQQAMSAIGGLGGNRQEREQDIFNRIRAIQSPDEERAQSALDRKLFAQGRMGVQTNEFGGTPEQLAMAKAQSEARNQAAFQAMNQAGTEMERDQARALGLSGASDSMLNTILGRSSQQASQAGSLASMEDQMRAGNLQRGSQLQQAGLGALSGNQAFGQQNLQSLLGLQNQRQQLQGQSQALGQQNLQSLLGLQNQRQQLQNQELARQTGQLGLGQSALSAGFLPESQVMNQQQLGTQLGNLINTGQRDAGGLLADLGMQGLESQVYNQSAANELVGQLISGATQIGSQGINSLVSGDNSVGGLFSTLLGEIGGLFGIGE